MQVSQGGGAALRGQTWRSLLIFGSAFAGAAGTVTIAVCALWGTAAASGAAVGVVLAVLALAAGPLLLRTVAQWSPPAVMAAALGGYLVIVFVLGLAYALLAVVDGISHLHLGVALVVCALAQSVGQTVAVARLRLLAFGADGDAGRATEVPGQHAREGAPDTARD